MKRATDKYDSQIMLAALLQLCFKHGFITAKEWALLRAVKSTKIEGRTIIRYEDYLVIDEILKIELLNYHNDDPYVINVYNIETGDRELYS